MGIIGLNGSGKTTLLRLISKVLLPQKGVITLTDRDISTIVVVKENPINSKPFVILVSGVN